MDDRIRRRTEEIERQTLSLKAAFSDCCRGRLVAEETCPIRTAFQRDRDRIIHCNAFRRLKHKTQVFLSPEGDHYRTRLTHTLEVAQIARTVARALRLNEDLTEAISLGHDLGHTPFGHAGERALNELFKDFGGFRHYEQSVRVCTTIEKNGRGLNLTYETLNGIMCHTKGTPADTLEGRCVRISDQIAYINHDIDDAVRAGVITEENIPLEIRRHFGNSKSERINKMVWSLIENSGDDIMMSCDDRKMFDRLHAYLFDSVYLNPKAKSEESKVFGIIEGLYNHFVQNTDKLPVEYVHILNNDGKERAVIDYIAGMTDTYAVQYYENLFIPRSWHL